MKFLIKIEPEAHLDIQEAINWYNSKQKGLGRKFYNQVKEYLKYLETSPYHEIKYDNVRCLPLKKFPYTVHFSIDELKKSVIIRAIFHASKTPDNWKNR